MRGEESESVQGSCEAVIGPADIRAHVARVLNSAPFERSPRMQRFLRFLCDEMLAGRGASLKEYTLAVAVFDKPEDFDPGTSAVVRVEAGRLRRLLAQYQAEYGMDDRLRLSVPKGSYCPVFEAKSTELEQTSPDPQLAEHPETLRSGLLGTGERRWMTVIACAFGDDAIAQAVIDGDFLSAYDVSHGLCASIADRHGGTLDAGASDRIIIYFGWPDALEDAAGRAMTAALEMVVALRTGLEPYGGIRIGVATSQVVARSTTGKPLIVGQAPALATRMMAQAPRDGILVSENTRRLSGTAFEMIPAGSVETQQGGSSLLWRLLRPRAAKTRFRASHGVAQSSLIGRREEMALLLSRWRLAAVGEGQAVVVEGEAGIGKSRLSEAVLAVARDGRHIRLQCSPHHTNSPLYPCIELVKLLIGDDPAPPMGEDRIAEFLERFGLDGPVNRALMGSLLFQSHAGAASMLPASQKKELTLKLLLAMLTVQMGRRPTILLIEDIHWADPTTIELIEKVIAMPAESRLFVLMTGRPGSSSPFTRHTNVTFLRLSRLPRSACNEVIDRVLSAASLSSSARSAILEKAEGIPLFLEELTKLFLTLDGQPANPVLVPESLGDLLASQLGRLGAARSIAQVAAVIGRAFSSELLRIVTGDERSAIEAALDQLLAAGILTRSRSETDSRFSFRHALLRDAAYASILDVDRRELHYRVGTVLVDSFADVSADHPEIIASHMRDAGRHDEAIPFWVDAGRKAAGRYELTEAIADFRHALEALAMEPSQAGRGERELEILLELGLTVRNAHGYFDPELQSIYGRARRLAEELRRPESLASAIYGLWTHAAGTGRWPIARDLAQEFQQLSRSIDDDGQLEIEASRLLGAGAAFGGEFALARLHFERAINLYDIDRHGPRFGYDPGAASAAYLSWTLWHLGVNDEAHRYAEMALHLAEAKGHPSTLAMVLAWLTFHAVCEQNLDAVQCYNDRLQALCTERDCRYWQPFGAACVEWAAFQSDAMPVHLSRLLDRTKEFQEHYLTSCLLLLGADICRQVRRPEQGLEVAAEAKRFIDAHEERIWEAECSRLTGQLLLMLPQPDHRKASQHLRRALRIAHQQQAVSLQRRATALIEASSNPEDNDIQSLSRKTMPARHH